MNQITVTHDNLNIAIVAKWRVRIGKELLNVRLTGQSDLLRLMENRSWPDSKRIAVLEALVQRNAA